MNILIDSNLWGCFILKKFMTILTLAIIVFSIISWGLIGVNIENTEAFNNQNYELSEKVDYDRIKEETGMDLTKFSEDNSPVKIYENKEKKTDTIIQTTLPLNFDEKKSEVEEEVKNIDILNITPIEAINILSKLKEKVK